MILILAFRHALKLSLLIGQSENVYSLKLNLIGRSGPASHEILTLFLIAYTQSST